MTINWYSFYFKLGAISSTAVVLGLLLLTPFISIGADGSLNIDEMTDIRSIMPVLIFMFIMSISSWVMTIKYKHLRNMPETTTKNEGKLYGIIGISLILLFLLFLIAYTQ